MIKEYENFNIPNFFNLAEIAMGYTDGITGKLEKMPMWLQYIDLLKAPIAFYNKSMGYIVSELAMIFKDDFIQLDVYSESMLESCSKNNNIFGILYGYIFKSISNYKIYWMREAKDSLLEAINLAENDNIIICFVELAPHILPILTELKKENLYVKSFISKCIKFNEISEESYSKKVKI